jgi:hypothetical protein
VYRGIRSAVITPISMFMGLWLGDGTLTGAWDVIADNWNVMGGATLASFLIAVGVRRYVDPSRVPSLTDPPVDPPVDDIKK